MFVFILLNLLLQIVKRKDRSDSQDLGGIGLVVLGKIGRDMLEDDKSRRRSRRDFRVSQTGIKDLSLIII